MRGILGMLFLLLLAGGLAAQPQLYKVWSRQRPTYENGYIGGIYCWGLNVGDFNGDGLEDIVDTEGGMNYARLDFFFNTPEGLANVVPDTTSVTTGEPLPQPDSTYHYYAYVPGDGGVYNLSSLGDVNGDGCDDIYLSWQKPYLFTRPDGSEYEYSTSFRIILGGATIDTTAFFSLLHSPPSVYNEEGH